MIPDEKKKHKVCVTISYENKQRLDRWKDYGYDSASDMINSILDCHFARGDIKKVNKAVRIKPRYLCIS